MLQKLFGGGCAVEWRRPRLVSDLSDNNPKMVISSVPAPVTSKQFDLLALIAAADVSLGPRGRRWPGLQTHSKLVFELCSLLNIEPRKA